MIVLRSVYKVPHPDTGLKSRRRRKLKRGNTAHRRSSCVYERRYVRFTLLMYRCCLYTFFWDMSGCFEIRRKDSGDKGQLL